MLFDTQRMLFGRPKRSRSHRTPRDEAREVIGVEISELRYAEAQRALRRFAQLAPEAAHKATRESRVCGSGGAGGGGELHMRGCVIWTDAKERY